MVVEGDCSSEEWFASLGAARETERLGRQVYRTLNLVADSLPVRGWSHYFHWYCDASSWNEKPVDKNVHPISENDPNVWAQWLSWPGPCCQQRFESELEVSDAFGYLLEGRLVSVAQLQTSQEEFAWEFGVDTLREFRNRGFATEVSRAATSLILERERIPWYYYDHYNHASARIPQKLGFFLHLEGVFSHST